MQSDVRSILMLTFLTWVALCACASLFCFYVLPILKRIPEPKKPKYPARYLFSYLVYRGGPGERVQTGSGWSDVTVHAPISTGEEISIITAALVENTQKEDPSTTSVTIISWQRMEEE